ncbi:MAG: 3-isopropylmalate dehydrogenase [Clostridiales Family XIII bacterium]|nr:3-isopropylmalate dehydrogenase [Clostridiales Family XIII bacterium]
MKYDIAVTAGDGIGPEVTDEAVKVLNRIGERFGHVFRYDRKLVGGAAIDSTGNPLPDETVDACKRSDATLFGAVGGPAWDGLRGELRPEQAILRLRKELGLYANLRPAIVFEELSDASPLKYELLEEGLDILIVRELTGGIYFGPKGTAEIENGRTKDGILSACIDEGNMRPADGRAAYDTEFYTESEIRRIGVTAFAMARKRRNKVVSVDKSNVLETSRLWREIMESLHEEYPDVKLEHMYADNAAMQLIRDPNQFDVIVTSNMFGDILSDEASQITGSIGMLPSASLGDGNFGLYEPIHGSAPDIAGKDLANPIASILSAAMLLRYSLSLADEANAAEAAVSKFLKKGFRTPDICADWSVRVGTREAGDLIADFI